VTDLSLLDFKRADARAADLMPTIAELQTAGAASLRAIAAWAAARASQ
jgi:hypothetical protein